MTDEEYRNLKARLPELRQRKVESIFGEIPESVQTIRELLDVGVESDNRPVLYSLMLSECSIARNDTLYLHYLRESASVLADDPIAVGGAAYAISIVDPASRTESLKLARRSLDIAVQQNRLVKFCAANLIRIGLYLNEYDSVEYGLRTLINERNEKRIYDYGYEFDFEKNIDPSRIGEQLWREFRSLAAEYSKA